MRQGTRWLGLPLACALASACGGSSSDDGSSDTGASSSATSDASAATTALDSTGGGTATDTGASTMGPADSSGGAACTDEFPAIVTDIDETLTLSDEEFAMQLTDGNYDPIERESAAEMVNGYADLGYRVVYLTARAETFTTGVTNESAREVTERWLQEHGFPFGGDETMLVLAPSVVLGDATQAYKAGAIADLQAQGWRFDYAYGNADTDFGAYEDAMIGKDVTFSIGELAGMFGTTAITEEGYTQHVADHLPTVPAVCDAAGG